MEKTFNWVIVGAGGIAGEMASAFMAMGRQPYGVAGRTREKAQALAERCGAEKLYESPQQAFEDPNVDIVYLATPHNTHAELIKQALAAGKHVLCEKAITLNSEELERCVTLAGQKGLVLAEAMTIWHMPLYQELWQRLAAVEWGKVQLIQLNFGSFKDYDMTNRFFNPELAGGALLDIGVYALSCARSFLASAPDQVPSRVRLAPTGVDEQAVILLQNPENQMATVTMSLRSKLPKRVVIGCEQAYIEIDDYPRAQTARVVDAATGAVTQIQAGETGRALEYEVIAMEQAVRTGDASAMRLGWSRDVMNIMTALRREWGVRYPGEEF